MKRFLVLATFVLACRAPPQHGVTVARDGSARARVVVTAVFPFYCTMHQPAMSGQVVVIGP